MPIRNLNPPHKFSYVTFRSVGLSNCPTTVRLHFFTPPPFTGPVYSFKNISNYFWHPRCFINSLNDSSAWDLIWPHRPTKWLIHDSPAHSTPNTFCKYWITFQRTYWSSVLSAGELWRFYNYTSLRWGSPWKPMSLIGACYWILLMTVTEHVGLPAKAVG